MRALFLSKTSNLCASWCQRADTSRGNKVEVSWRNPVHQSAPIGGLSPYPNNLPQVPLPDTMKLELHRVLLDYHAESAYSSSPTLASASRHALHALQRAAPATPIAMRQSRPFSCSFIPVSAASRARHSCISARGPTWPPCMCQPA